MSWTTPDELRAQVRRSWERGDLLRAMLCMPGVPGASGSFPLQLRFKAPGSAEIGERFEAVKAWLRQLDGMPHVRLEWRELNHRLLGRQRLPASAWVDSLDAALALCGKRSEAAAFARMLEQTRAAQPALLDWLARRPLQAMELAPRWPQLLAAVCWMAAHPRPGIYLRQADIPGMHSKFMESHRGVLAELLDLVLPPEAISSERTGIAQFAVRYGFRDKPGRIRLRMLDPGIATLPGVRQPDMTLDADSFASLALPLAQVFITENETNFLCFPDRRDAAVIFGAGYGWDMLARASWLRHCALHYWGDIDTHGFAILDQLRSRFPHAQSMLMDRATLMAHEALWSTEAEPVRHELGRLDEQERALFDELRSNRIRPGIRLEQEWIGFGWVLAALDRLK